MTALHEDADVVEVRHQICAWDPLRFYAANGVSPEEYEQLIRPLLTRLAGGADAEKVVEYLDHELHHHFGSYPDETLVWEFAEKLVAWYAGSRAQAPV